MDTYLLLRFGHFAGFILLGGGLLAVFLSELRAYRTDDPDLFAEAAWYTAVFYDALAVPGALLLAISGGLLMRELGYGLLELPWLTAMWMLFLFEFLEGNTVTRLQFRRTLRRSRKAVAAGVLTDEARDEARNWLGQIAHFLDIPLFLVIVWCGVARPATWISIGIAVVLAVTVAVVLTLSVPRLVRSQAANAVVARGRAGE